MVSTTLRESLPPVSRFRAKRDDEATTAEFEASVAHEPIRQPRRSEPIHSATRRHPPHCTLDTREASLILVRRVARDALAGGTTSPIDARSALPAPARHTAADTSATSSGVRVT